LRFANAGFGGGNQFAVQHRPILIAAIKINHAEMTNAEARMTKE
jgi:hypothetical protein